MHEYPLIRDAALPTQFSNFEWILPICVFRSPRLCVLCSPLPPIRFVRLASSLFLPHLSLVRSKTRNTETKQKGVVLVKAHGSVG